VSMTGYVTRTLTATYLQLLVIFSQKGEAIKVQLALLLQLLNFPYKVQRTGPLCLQLSLVTCGPLASSAIRMPEQMPLLGVSLLWVFLSLSHSLFQVLVGVF
jgi:hypothetical protein